MIVPVLWLDSITQFGPESKLYTYEMHLLLALCVQHGFNKLPTNLGYLLEEIPAWFSQSTIRRDEYKVLHEELNIDST